MIVEELIRELHEFSPALEVCIAWVDPNHWGTCAETAAHVTWKDERLYINGISVEEED